MPWIVGIDEAGYGPNLGPFVMSAALFHVPDGIDQNLWKVLRPAIRKAHHKADGRYVVDDSKKVYSPKLGIGVLEQNVRPFLNLACKASPGTFGELGDEVVLTPRPEFDHEPYVCWDQRLSLETESVARMALLRGVLEKTGIQLQCLRSSVVSPRSFNRLVRQTDSKGSIPLQSLGELITSLTRHIQDQEYIQITVDRLGGRWHYAERMRDWFADLEIRCVEETASVSRYQVGDNLEIAFVVEADQTSLPVALASMLSKYLRELFMGQFNAWFRGHQPEIAPTAGYPMDSHRFWADAEPTRNRLGLRNEDWWRER